MTRSNRVLNRVLIALVGLVTVATGLVLEVPKFAPMLSLSKPELSTPDPLALWIGLGVCIVIVVLCLLWIFSRGRGRTSDLLILTDDHGSITVDTRVAADLIADALANNRDIVSVGSGAYRMRGERVLSLRVVARKGANLPILISSVSSAVEELDVVLERRIPLRLQVVSGLGVREVRTR